jgi:hypothetical protein
MVVAVVVREKERQLETCPAGEAGNDDNGSE